MKSIKNEPIYFDNAATGFPKSNAVLTSVLSAMSSCGNAGRSGHIFSENASMVLYDCREKLAALFSSLPEKVVLCNNATMALNMAIKGIGLKKGGAALTSDIEHNSVTRPLFSLEKYGIRTDTFEVSIESDDMTVSNFKSAVKDDTTLCVFTHASNVCGRILPVERLAAEAKKKGITVIVDASQTAGTLPLKLGNGNIDVVCLPGHKGLYGPLGTGALIVDPASDVEFETVIEGGSGISSEDERMPELLPERLESGTANAPAFAGLSAACDENEYLFDELVSANRTLVEGLRNISGIKLYGAPENNFDSYVPTVLINREGTSTDELFDYLSRNGFCVRSGLHCSPAAHRKLGTIGTGGVRISLGKHNRRFETKRLLALLNNYRDL